MAISSSLRAAVRQRAMSQCEYCHLSMHVIPEPFHVEHIVAKQHHGETLLHNLALACSRCNSHKGPNLVGIDPETGQTAPLFNPRRDSWLDHFRRAGSTIRGTTAVGRTTVAVLNMNEESRVELRAVLIEEGRMPGSDG